MNCLDAGACVIPGLCPAGLGRSRIADTEHCPVPNPRYVNGGLVQYPSLGENLSTFQRVPSVSEMDR